MNDRPTSPWPGFLSLFLGIQSLLAVVVFHFPEYLTTPSVRKSYDIDLLRLILSVGMMAAAAFGFYGLIRRSRYAKTGLVFTGLALLLGGPFVPLKDFADGTPYIGLDWLILDLLGTGLIFILIEKALPHKKAQPVLRQGWALDLKHFAVNHLLIGVSVLLINAVATKMIGPARTYLPEVGIQNLPFLLQLPLAILFADLFQYWIHRALHEVPVLWRFHSVHHSTEVMDWLAGSRMHLIEMLLTRAVVLAPLFALGFTKPVIDAYIIVAALQAVFIHANVNFKNRWVEKLIVTPRLHHWHHGSDREAIDKNYAAHLSFLDRLFGTTVIAEAAWPQQYGVVGKKLPGTYLGQQAYPFKKHGQRCGRSPQV